MRLTFRAKLTMIVGTAAVAFGVLITAGAIISARTERELLHIREHYVPKLDLGPKLDATFEQLRRGMQDAVAAQNPEALAQTVELKRQFEGELADAGGAVNLADAATLRAAFDDYYATADDVSRRLIAGETGEALVGTMQAMQAKQLRVSNLLKKTVTFDRAELNLAFDDASGSQRAAAQLRLVISVGCLVAVIALSLWLSQGVLKSLSELTAGLQRFGQGDFAAPIRVVSADELGDVARQANQMAERLAQQEANLRATNEDLEQQKRDLERSNHELEAFSYSVSHDLRAPLRSIDGFSQALLEDYTPVLDDEGKKFLRYVRESAQHMGEIIDGLISLAKVTRSDFNAEKVDLTALARGIGARLAGANPDRKVDFVVADGLTAQGDRRLLGIALENLLGNAWKFTGKTPAARIEVGRAPSEKEPIFFVRDNGAGFDMTYAKKLFGAFQRLHATNDFDGTGIGLATVDRILQRHGGRIWAEGKPGEGATFFLSL